MMTIRFATTAVVLLTWTINNSLSVSFSMALVFLVSHGLQSRTFGLASQHPNEICCSVEILRGPLGGEKHAEQHRP